MIRLHPIHIIVLLLSGFAAAVFWAPQSRACTICAPEPVKTLADKLREQPHVILAREIPGSPYNFRPVETLKGPEDSKPFSLYCHSSIRRKLQVINDSAIVVGRGNTDTSWSLIIFADPATISFVHSIIAAGEDWGEGYDTRERLDFFAGYLSNEHPLIQEQVFLELGRAPYAVIKKLAAEVPREKIHTLLADQQLVAWHKLYILMLGQSTNREDHAYIRSKLEATARTGVPTNLAAWLTAFIETHPDSGVEEVERLYFRDRNRSKDELKEVLISLSQLGSQLPMASLRMPRLRRSIIDSYGVLLENYPDQSGSVARDLAMWQVRAHVDRLTEILADKEGLDPEAVYLVEYYLSMASGFRGAL